MNQRPTRAPPPPNAANTVTQQVQESDRAEDASFTEIERPNNLPAARPAQAQPPVNEEVPQAEAQPPLPKTECGKLLSAIAAVMSEITPVEKGGWNKFQSYAFARMQDLLVTITPLMGKHGIVVFQHEEGREMFDSGKAIAVRYRFTIVHKSGEVWFERPLQTGLSNCRNSKDGFDDKALNKCHTAARKYFLMSLFQIPTEDADDGDGSTPPQNNGQQRPQGRRPVPSPTGKLSPHLLPIIDGEAPADWAKRFNAFIAKAETAAEIDQWYDANAMVFEKLKGRFADVYDALIDGMDVRAAALNGAKKPDPISSGKSASDFPGDKPMPKFTPEEQEWLGSLKLAFDNCDTAEEIGAEQDSLMMPSQGSVSQAAWDQAIALTNAAVNRVSKGK